ncbi:MAG: MFS transporter [Chloroflexota bacterium]|nr:MFS transporter [Ardenticatenaceae bacterium]
MITRHLSSRTFSPALVGALYYWFYWSFVAVYDPYLNVYLAQLGLNGVQLGILATILPLAMLIYSPFVAALADQHGRLRILKLLIAGWGVLLLFMQLPRTFWGILPLIIILAVTRTPTIPIGDSIVARMTNRHNLNFGSMRLWGSIGFASFSILCGFIWEQTGFAPMFWTAAVLSIPAIYITAKLDEGPLETSQSRPSMRLLLQDKSLVVLLIIAFLAGIPLVSTYVFGGITMTAIGGSETHIGFMFGMSALGEVPTMLTSNSIIRRLRAPQSILLSLLIMSLALVGYALATAPWILILASVGKGLGYGLFIITLVRLVDERAGAWASTAQSMMNAAMIGLAPLLTSPLSGYVFDRWGAQVLFASVSGSLFASAVLMGWALHRGWFSKG